MRKEPFLRILLFIIFSFLGIAAISLSMLAQEWLDLYTTKSKLWQVEQTNLKIEALNRDHQTLIGQIHSDPNILKRLDRVVLGIAPPDNNLPVVTASGRQLEKAKALLAEDEPEKTQITAPGWLKRCGKGQSRLILFSAGAGLILVSFACFGKVRD